MWMFRYHNRENKCKMTGATLPPLAQNATSPSIPAWAVNTTRTLPTLLDLQRSSALNSFAPKTIKLAGRTSVGNRGPTPWPLPPNVSSLSYNDVQLVGVNAAPKARDLVLKAHRPRQSQELQLRARYDPDSRAIWVVVIEALGPPTVMDPQTNEPILRPSQLGPCCVRTTWVELKELDKVHMVQWGNLGLNNDYKLPDGSSLLEEKDESGEIEDLPMFVNGVKLDGKKILREWVRQNKMGW
jgi:hypothetical protein